MYTYAYVHFHIMDLPESHGCVPIHGQLLLLTLPMEAACGTMNHYNNNIIMVMVGIIISHTRLPKLSSEVNPVLRLEKVLKSRILCKSDQVAQMVESYAYNNVNILSLSHRCCSTFLTYSSS